MAEHIGPQPGADFHDMKAHEQTWHGFLRLIKWMIFGAVILLLVLLIWRTNNG
ncbi:MAG TPA: aa3-type cytochrome c oxidase subunit IV [Rhizomicrobium sp.]